MTHLVHRLFARYLPNPRQFRAQMQKNNCIISGSTVLWLLEGCSDRWQPHDLDIYTPKGNAKHIIQYLLEQGFKIRSITEDSSSFMDYFEQKTSLLSVTKMTHAITGAKVDVLESNSRSAVRPLLNFHSTLVMNYIDQDTIVSFYAAMTYDKTGCAPNSRYIDEHELPHLHKYVERGFRIYGGYKWQSLVHTDALCPRLIRFNGDKRCLSIRYDQLSTSRKVASPTIESKTRHMLKWQVCNGRLPHRKCSACRKPRNRSIPRPSRPGIRCTFTCKRCS